MGPNLCPLVGAHRHIISDMMLNLAKQNLIFVFLWWIHFDIWQNQFNIVKFKKKKKTIFFCAQTLRLLGEFLDLESFFNTTLVLLGCYNKIPQTEELISNRNLFLTVLESVIVQSFSCVWLFATPWTAAYQASLSFIISQSLLKLMSIGSVMPSNHLILCHHLLLLPSIFPSIRVFSNELFLRIRWSKYCSFSISPSNEYSELISLRIDWFDPL